MISLGCAKNLVDAEIMLGALAADGMEVTSEPGEADAVIVNTCSFIDAAQEESVDAILEQAAWRDAKARRQAIVVAGCLPQRYREELRGLLPEVDAFMGVDEVRRAPAIVREALEHRKAVRQTGRPRSARSGGRPLPPPGAGADRVTPEPAVQVTRRPIYIPDYATPRFRLTPRHTTFLKIAEGCNHPCSFCIIPRMRGAHRSRSEDDVVEEARQLLEQGVRELNLISQDTTYYGLDRRTERSGSIAAPEPFRAATTRLPAGAPTLARLLARLNDLPGEFWIRVLYTHPAHWTEELIETMAGATRVARYVDMPLQHIDDVMLQRMRRETSRTHIERLIERLRIGIPGITLRTTFIVGFPGETVAQFEALLDFIRATRFERVGVFTYSHEQGTVAATMRGQVPETERGRRRDLAMEAQCEVSRSLGLGWVDRTLTVLVDGPASIEDLAKAGVDETGLAPVGGTAGGTGWWVARSQGDAPDVDGRVFIRGRAATGTFVQARIRRSTVYDLIGEVVEVGRE